MRALPRRRAGLDQGGGPEGNGAGRIRVSRNMGKSHPVDQRAGYRRDQEESRNKISHPCGRPTREMISKIGGERRNYAVSNDNSHEG